MAHSKIVWNLNTKQSFCTTCGRTSEKINLEDARAELDQFVCQLPYVESGESRPGEETVRLMKKPFKMVPKNAAE
jgi:hypothetical protein